MSLNVYGDRLGSVLKIERAPAVAVQVLRRALFAATRIRCDEWRKDGMTAPIPHEDAYNISLQLRQGLPYELWLDGRPVKVEPAKAFSTSLFDVNRDPMANLQEPFDCLVFYVPRAALEAFTEDVGAPRIGSLHIPGITTDDPVVKHLGACLLPAVERPEQANRLFTEHVAMGLHAHLVRTYAQTRFRESRRAGLAPWQERRVKELLMTRLDGEVSLEELARECRLSRSHFARAFKNTTGLPPHRWLLHRRLERARELLTHSALPIAEIARLVGFADASHFTRVFGKTNGVSPGAWRRQRR